MAREVQIIYQSCKRLVPVIDKKVMDHPGAGGAMCEHSGEKYIPQGFKGVPVSEYLNEIAPEGHGYWESVTPENMPDLDKMEVLSQAPVFSDKACTRPAGGLTVLRDKENSDVYAMKATVQVADTEGAPAGKYGRD